MPARTVVAGAVKRYGEAREEKGISHQIGVPFMLSRKTVSRTVTLSAPLTTVFGLVLRVHEAPQWHPGAIHAEHLGRSDNGDTDRVRLWSLKDEKSVRTRVLRREIRDGESIVFEHEDPARPGGGVRGGWYFTARADDVTEVEMRHDLGPADAGPGLAEAVARETVRYLDALREAAEHDTERRRLVLSFEDPLFIVGDVKDVYDVLYEADRWPERMAHVDRLTMTEDEPNIQFFDMDTRTSDGSPHTTRSVRVCLPHREIVYKQIRLPRLLDAHTGYWRFTEAPEGVLARAGHSVTIKPSALGLLGEGTTAGDARRYLRRVLGTNSMGNLRVAKGYAEERAGSRGRG
ncbi:SRPBCC family protein [Streptomyces iconiensis]|uniref:SRPBCC family protein n=1 Tax=Streptomyces iconiensis TaxID=1384038 RepID=A0ABT7A6D4_9ACTN|nr:SRPBCC family protein [Streptomyces iconiensis]MDJ1136898.1 SRPBCC family protein [Streptomyces iconiensis]